MLYLLGENTMPENKMQYSDKINELLSEMPEFVSDFIYNFGRVENYATKLEYCRDIKVYLEFITNYLPKYCDKSIKELSIDDVANIEILDINRFLTTLSGNHKETTVKRKRASLSSMGEGSGHFRPNPVKFPFLSSVNFCAINIFPFPFWIQNLVQIGGS